jgi:hypothetical protein
MSEPITAGSHWLSRFAARAKQLRALAPVVWLLPGCELEGKVGYWIDTTPPSAAGAGAKKPPSTTASDASAREDVDAGNPSPGVSTAEPTDNTGNAGSNASGPSNGATSAQPDACALARPGAEPLVVTVVDTNAVTYNFADGALFPAGRYRVEYVDGCRRYDNTAAWTLHASLVAAGLSSEGRGGCYLIMSNDQAVELAPGTAGVVVGEGPDPLGAYGSYDECVAANRMQAPRDLTLSAGAIGIMNAGDSSPDKTTGEAIGRRSPTYCLTRLDACP